MMNVRLVALMAILTLSITSCLKKPELEDDHGPEVSVTELQQELLKAWGDADPLSIAVNEFTYIEKDQAIEDMPAKLVGQEGITVAEKTVGTDEVTYKLIKQVNEIVDGQSKLSTKEEIIKVPVVSTQSDFTIKSLGVQVLQSLLMACMPEEGWDVSCHNLKVTEEVKSAPDLVRAQENCAGIPDCKMTYKTIAFDLVLRTPSTSGMKTEKVNYSVTISPEAPYLSRLMNFCYRGVVTVNPSNNQYLVKLCNRVMNFKFGQ